MIYASLKPIAAVAQPLHRARLSDLRADDRRGAAQRAPAPLRRRGARSGDPRRARDRRRLGLEDRHLAPQRRARAGRRRRTARPGSRAETSAPSNGRTRKRTTSEGDGLPDRPQARGEAPPRSSISSPSPCRLRRSRSRSSPAAAIGIVAAVVAVLAQAPGMLAERWLFFAEAKHAVTLYYGR